MDQEQKGRELNVEEEKEFREGSALREMVETGGFGILRKKLEDLGFHSWVDPRDSPNKEEWEWKELSGFHAANAARELLEWIDVMISRAEALGKKKSGEEKERNFRI